jgi:purine-cytosine permease-like protein
MLAMMYRVHIRVEVNVNTLYPVVLSILLAILSGMPIGIDNLYSASASGSN